MGKTKDTQHLRDRHILIDATGRPTHVVLTIEAYERIADLVEEADDVVEVERRSFRARNTTRSTPATPSRAPPRPYPPGVPSPKPLVDVVEVEKQKEIRNARSCAGVTRHEAAPRGSGAKWQDALPLRIDAYQEQSTSAWRTTPPTENIPAFGSNPSPDGRFAVALRDFLSYHSCITLGGERMGGVHDSDPAAASVPESEPEVRRGVILFGGFLLSLMGGMSYAWGSFVVPLTQDWGWTAAQANLPFTVMIIVFAIAMIPAGWVQDTIGPRKVATWGAALFFIGYALSGLLRYIPHPGWLVFSYGLIVGVACGLTYACIAPTARKWYSDRPGFAVSTAVMGFGLAAVVFAPLKRSMIDLWGVDGTLLVLSAFVGAVALVGARLIRNPPYGYTAPERKTAAGRLAAAAVVEDVPPKRFIRTPVFYLLWVALAMVIGGGLTAIGLITAYGEIELNLAPAVAATAISAYALVNGLGRPVAGYLSDRIGTLRVMIIVYSIQAVVFFALPRIAVNLPLLILCSLFLGLGYATTFALFPVLVAARFGTRHLGMNYGLVFSAFGMGAVTSLVGSWLLDTTGSFTPAFTLASGTTVAGLVLLFILRGMDGAQRRQTEGLN